MVKNTIIVGAGFAAMIAHLMLKDSAVVFSAPSNIQAQYRNRGFQFNKFFGVWADSCTKLINKLSCTHLHDRVVHGGNGTIWGGFVNTRTMSLSKYPVLQESDILLMPLSYCKTGSVSSDPEIRQFQFSSGVLLNPARVFDVILERFLERFEVLDSGALRLHWAYSEGPSNQRLEVEECRELVLAVGVVQLIDLLYRSNFLKEHDFLELSEFEYELKLVFKANQFVKEVCSIRIGILRGLCHYLGVQYYPRCLAFIDRFIPIAFEQRFSRSKIIQKFKIENGTLVEVAPCGSPSFGKSIHYCNLKINGIEANKFLKNMSSRIIGLGMAFIDQKVPGPIANDIFEDVIKKVYVEK